MKRVRHIRVTGRNGTESAMKCSKRVVTYKQHIVKLASRLVYRQGLKWKRLRRGKAIWVSVKRFLRRFRSWKMNHKSLSSHFIWIQSVLVLVSEWVNRKHGGDSTSGNCTLEESEGLRIYRETRGGEFRYSRLSTARYLGFHKSKRVRDLGSCLAVLWFELYFIKLFIIQSYSFNSSDPWKFNLYKFDL